MKHEIVENKERYLVRIEGEVDLSCSEQLRDLLLGAVARSPHVVVDLSDVTVIDSSGIASLLDGEQTAKKSGRTFEIHAPSPQVMRVLKLARLDTVFTITTG